MGRIGNIINKKGKQDAKRAKVFTKHSRAIAVAAKEGGKDPEYNAALKTAIEKAKADNMPNDNIDRAVAKGAGAGANENYETIVYEGYGPAGVAVIVEALTDNKNRTAGNVRYYFDKNGGNLGTSGCVGFMFDNKGQILIEANDEVNEEELMDLSLELGAEDFITEEDGYEVITTVEDFSAVRDGLKEKGYEFISADVKMIPQTTTELTDEEQIKAMNKMIDMLEDDDDVQNIFHNLEINE
ncbi:MAG: YebC/PmpR family DNA-binding transcriptional regulator [Peptostreptococcaceae bacterium]